MAVVSNGNWTALANKVRNRDIKIPEPVQTPSDAITLPEGSQDFTWTDNNTYTAGQPIDASGWDARQIKDFRDATGAKYKSEDVTRQFDQWSLDNLDGMSQYEFQLNGTGDQWADMITSPELNRFWQGYGVNEGDRESALAFYDYYDGTKYDEDNNVTQIGTGINQLSQLDFNNYTDIENVAGSSAKALSAFNRGYIEDAQDLGDGRYEFDGIKTGDLSDDALAKMNMETFAAFNSDAARKGAMEDRPEDGSYDLGAKRIYDTANAVDPAIDGFRSRNLLMDKRNEEPEFFTRELGRTYGEPTIDPDHRPRDMWDLDELAELGMNAGMISNVETLENGERTGETTPEWLPTGPVRGSSAFEYTEGALDNLGSGEDLSRETFESALSLMGDDVRRANYVDLNEDGTFRDFVNAPWTQNLTSERDQEALPNQMMNGVLMNSLDEEGQMYKPLDLLGNPLTGPTTQAIDPTYTDSFLEREMGEGGIISGSIAPGWTPTEQLAKKHGWSGDDYRVFADFANSAKYMEGPFNELGSKEDDAIAAVEKARADRAKGINKDPFSYNRSLIADTVGMAEAIQSIPENAMKFGNSNGITKKPIFDYSQYRGEE